MVAIKISVFCKYRQVDEATEERYKHTQNTKIHKFNSSIGPQQGLHSMGRLVLLSSSCDVYILVMFKKTVISLDQMEISYNNILKCRTLVSHTIAWSIVHGS